MNHKEQYTKLRDGEHEYMLIARFVTNGEISIQDSEVFLRTAIKELGTIEEIPFLSIQESIWIGPGVSNNES